MNQRVIISEVDSFAKTISINKRQYRKVSGEVGAPFSTCACVYKLEKNFMIYFITVSIPSIVMANLLGTPRSFTIYFH